MVLSVVAASNYIVIVVAANSALDVTERWTKGFLISFLQDMVTGQSFKALFNAVLINLLKRDISTTRAKVVGFFTDRLLLRAVAMVNS